MRPQMLVYLFVFFNLILIQIQIYKTNVGWRILYTGPPLLSPTSPLETHRLRAQQLRDGSSHNVASEMLPAKTVPPLEHFLSQEVGKVARNIIYLFVHYHSNVCLYVSSNVSVSESVQVVHWYCGGKIFLVPLYLSELRSDYSFTASVNLLTFYPQA